MKQARPVSVKRKKSTEKHATNSVDGEISWSRRRRRQGVRQKKPFQWKYLLVKAWRYLRFISSTLAMILVVLSPYLVWQYLETHDVFQIQRVVIHSNAKYLVGERKEKLINELLGQNIVSYDVENFRNTLSQNPWVKNIEVKRRWPDEIELMIDERKPIAIWNDLYLIEEDGSIFEPELMPSSSLINLVGNTDQKEKVLEGMIKIEAAINAVGLKVDKIILDYRGSWTIVLENNVELYLGASFFEERLKRFVSHYPSSIQSKMDSIIAVDFRYDRGYALKWKR